MNREIKFRGKRVKDGKWIYGNLANYAFNFRSLSIHKSVIFENIASFATDNFGYVIDDCEIDEETVWQFTGLYDRNGKEIYDGDIVRIYDGERCFNIVVKWSKEAMAFMACYCDGNQSPLSWFSGLLSKTHEVEVVGNIYDNKNLLEETE